VGTFPDDARAGTSAWDEWVARVQRYMEKAIREGKVHTSWTNPNADYERAVRDFAARALASPAFVEDLAPFARRIAVAGRLSSLSQTALKLAAPGVPDVYQGCEVWDLSLVDPDNRRPVDYARRAGLLGELARRAAEGPEARAALARELARGLDAAADDGRSKLLLLREGLRLRRAEPALLRAGTYEPLAAEGRHAAHLVAFARRHEGRALLCAVPRLALRLLDGAGGRIADVAWDARLPLPPELRGDWVDLLTGARHEAGAPALEARRLFAELPVALLTSNRSAGA
jgi:(1->4)-alpha-D-glucan 1-alpha-D-glucosylmutase